MKKGFTLVELSIVLVVVGLLISGVLVGKSMITSARISSEIAQLSQFDTAVNNFRTQFGQLPGDTNLFGNSVGNNDGFINDGGEESYTGEHAKFWSDLAVSGFASEGLDYIDTSAGSGVSNAVLPKSKINSEGSVIPSSRTSPTSPSYTIGNFYYFSKFQAGGTGGKIICKNIYTPLEIQSIDIKIDDSVANQGTIVGFDDSEDNGEFATVINESTGAGVCTTTSDGPTYNVDLDELSCSMRVRMGATTGSLF